MQTYPLDARASGLVCHRQHVPAPPFTEEERQTPRLLERRRVAPKRDYFYWELHEGASLQAVRFAGLRYKAVKNGPSAKTELYDLQTDPGESKDLAATQPDLVAQAEALMRAAHRDDPNWPMRDKRR